MTSQETRMLDALERIQRRVDFDFDTTLAELQQQLIDVSDIADCAIADMKIRIALGEA